MVGSTPAMTATGNTVGTVTPSTSPSQGGFGDILGKINKGIKFMQQLKGQVPSSASDPDAPMQQIGGIIQGLGSLMDSHPQTHPLMGPPQTGLQLAPGRRPQLDPDQQRLAIMQAFNMQG